MPAFSACDGFAPMELSDALIRMEDMELPNLDSYFAAAEAQLGPRSVITEDPTLAGLGRLLLAARLELGFSRREAARLAGTSASQLERIERGSDARISAYRKLAKVYGCRVTVHATFPAMGPLWLKANLRRKQEEEARAEKRRRRWFARRGLAYPER